jgi:transcriptional regulator with XRE-family HTH domain
MSSIMETFGNNLRSYRKDRGISQAALAELAELSVTTVSFYETGARWPRLKEIGRLAKALRVEEDLLFLNLDAVDTPTLLSAASARLDALKK